MYVFKNDHIYVSMYAFICVYVCMCDMYYIIMY